MLPYYTVKIWHCLLLTLSSLHALNEDEAELQYDLLDHPKTCYNMHPKDTVSEGPGYQHYRLHNIFSTNQMQLHQINAIVFMTCNSAQKAIHSRAQGYASRMGCICMENK